MELASWYICMYMYVRDRCKIRTVLKPSDGFEASQTAAKRARRLRSGPDGCEAGQTVLQLFISTTDGFKAVQTDEQLSWTVPKLCIKCTAARFGYIFVKIHVVQCATLPYNSHMHGSLSLGQLGGKRSKPLEHNK